MLAQLVERVGGSVADGEHHAVVADEEPLQLHVYVVRGHGLRLGIETARRIAQEETCAELDLDAAGLVAQVEGLVDIALLVVRNHLTLDIDVRSVGSAHGFHHIVGHLHVLRIGVAARIAVVFERVLIGEDLLGIGNGDLDGTRLLQRLVRIDRGGSRSVEIVIATRCRKSYDRRYAYLKYSFHSHKLRFAVRNGNKHSDSRSYPACRNTSSRTACSTGPGRSPDRRRCGAKDASARNRRCGYPDC